MEAVADLLFDRGYLQKVPGLIESAQVRVRVAMFQMAVKGRAAKATSRELAGKLWAKAREGKDVRVILNVAPGKARVAAINRDAAKWLRERGVEVRMLWPVRICHAKMVIVDDRIAIIGSHNWSPSALSGNFEVSVVIRDPGTVRKLVEYFDQLWVVSKPLKG
jgi:phosphatidylserine/phosphatidylglycerophosphate/cardiolipin synthase-like enzyme